MNITQKLDEFEQKEAKFFATYGDKRFPRSWAETCIRIAHPKMIALLKELSQEKEISFKTSTFIDPKCSELSRTLYLRILDAHKSGIKFKHPIPVSAESLCVPTVKSANNMKITKYLSGYLNDPDSHKLISQLGQLIIQEGELKATVKISVDPADFIRIGTFGPDLHSCFGPFGQNSFHKFYLGIAPETFVIYVTKKQTIIARCLGFLQNDKYNLFNFYLTGTTALDVLLIIKSYLEELTGQEMTVSDGSNGLQAVGRIYHNGPDRTIIHPKNIKEIKSYLDPDHDSIVDLVNQRRLCRCGRGPADHQNIMQNNRSIIICQTCSREGKNKQLDF